MHRSVYSSTYLPTYLPTYLAHPYIRTYMETYLNMYIPTCDNSAQKRHASVDFRVCSWQTLGIELPRSLECFKLPALR